MYSKEEKEQVVFDYKNGVCISQISKSRGVSRSTVYSWIKECEPKEKGLTYGKYNALKSHCAKLELIIEILRKTDCIANTTLHEKYEIIKEMSSEYKIATLCSALGVAKGSYYNHILRNKNDDSLAAKRRREFTTMIEEIFENSKQTLGVPRIVAVLREKGYTVSNRFVSSIMKENGWFCVGSKSREIYYREIMMKRNKRKENKVKRNFNVKNPNEIWASDFTYFKVKGKRYYICVVLDLFSRKIIGMEVSKRNSIWLTKTTLKKAYAIRNPIGSKLVFHSDRGNNYVANVFMDYLKSLGIEQSFSQKGTPYDNAVVESFFNTLKREELYRTKYTSEKHFRESLKEYVEFYNENRPHTTLRYMTPNKAEEEYYRRKDLAKKR